MEKILKSLYKKDPKLAKEVAKITGYKITAKKDPMPDQIKLLIKTAFGVKPNKLKVKVKNGKTIYQFGELVDGEEDTGQMVIKLTNTNGEWQYVIGIPNIVAPDYEDMEDETFLATYKVKDEEKFFTQFKKELQRARNFMKAHGLKVNKDAEIGI